MSKETQIKCMVLYFFESMIFDSNNDETKPATTKNVDKYTFGNFDGIKGILYYTFWTDKKQKNQKQKSMYRFNFKQSDYGDVCTLINIINVLDYMLDEDSVNE